MQMKSSGQNRAQAQQPLHFFLSTTAGVIAPSRHAS
jgi:hypothetical protein